MHDDRVGAPRGPAFRYGEVVLDIHQRGLPFTDHARAWAPLHPLVHRAERVPRDYQRAALDAWVAADRRGTVVLPTGAGKTFVAELAIATSRRPTLVVAPTLDLVAQWHRRLSLVFGLDCGVLGGGQHTLADITISTYDSAYRHLGRYGDRFGLIVWDEVHHLPAPGYLEAACCAMAPFRLGLTATYERDDGREELLNEILGPVVYRVGITDLAGRFLADYDTVRVTVHLSEDERARYDACRLEFREFCTVHGISLGGRFGFQNFLRQSARSKAGRSAFRAYREYKSIAHGTESKIKVLAELLTEEHGRRTIVFTNDNATAFRVSRLLLLPCITHHTPVKERKHLLESFSDGALPTLVTSKVLNEGVDMPEAEVAIVVSGSGTVREHVQRLGRILRPRAGKRAVLYELVAADTTEVHASERRRQHAAYGGDDTDADT
ncbi:MAG TPA: helicase [Deltaproteobacteria bacterium]|nr:helicase [Deltaproteobacteria bacterium]